MSAKKTQEELEELIGEADDAFSHSPGKENLKSLYEEALKKAKKLRKKVEIQYIQGKMDLLDKKWEDALRHFDDAITLEPEFSRAWCYKSCALRNLERYKEALECSDRALKINPKDADAWYNKSCALNNLGRYKEALECSDRALEINAHHIDALNNKGILLRRTDKYEEALECYNKALEINPEDIDVRNNKGVLLAKMGNYEEALECYNKALEINPTYELARNNRNLTLIFLGRFDEAKEEREMLYSEKKKEISKSKISPDEKREKILEVEVKKKVVDELRHKCKEILDAKNEYKKKLSELLKPRNNPLNDNFLLVLRRWNSYTPAMLTATRSNFGGGYFLYWKGKGIAIDPGFDFLNNFFNSKLVIHDIDAVIITHAHVDHCSDFESILTLIFEYNEKKRKKKKIDVFMNVGTMKKLLSWIPIEEDKENLLILQ